MFLRWSLELAKPDELRSDAPAIETRDAKRDEPNTKVCWISHTIASYPALMIREARRIYNGLSRPGYIRHLQLCPDIVNKVKSRARIPDALRFTDWLV